MRRPVTQSTTTLGNSGVTILSGDEIKFSKAKPVISAAQKFVIPVAVLDDADSLVYPVGTKNAGQRITDWEGKPIGEKGIIFFNEVDKCYQAVPADGRSVIIINEVTGGHVFSLEEFIRSLPDPIHDLSKHSLTSLLLHVATLGLVDLYNSTDDFVLSKMIPVRPVHHNLGARPSGWMRRNDRDICFVVFVEGPARFQGPAATPQEIPAQGAFIVRQGECYRMVDADVMLRTYMNPDCSPLVLKAFL
jgi:hypothetical protein